MQPGEELVWEGRSDSPEGPLWVRISSISTGSNRLIHITVQANGPAWSARVDRSFSLGSFLRLMGFTIKDCEKALAP